MWRNEELSQTVWCIKSALGLEPRCSDSQPPGLDTQLKAFRGLAGDLGWSPLVPSGEGGSAEMSTVKCWGSEHPKTCHLRGKEKIHQASASSYPCKEPPQRCAMS